MKREYLGDSYDAVKRMWQQVLADWAPLYAEPRFIPEDLQAEFTRLTRIPMLSGKPRHAFSILNDPDTGIRLPSAKDQSEGRSHIALHAISKQIQYGAKCVITFDQSDYRNSGMDRDEQRQVKMNHLAKGNICSFYFVSHACFLFAMPNLEILDKAIEIIRETGIPDSRLESINMGYGGAPLDRLNKVQDNLPRQAKTE